MREFAMAGSTVLERVRPAGGLSQDELARRAHLEDDLVGI
jgi:hypothetical protein